MLKRNVLTKVVVTFNSNVLLKMAYRYKVIEVGYILLGQEWSLGRFNFANVVLACRKSSLPERTASLCANF